MKKVLLCFLLSVLSLNVEAAYERTLIDGWYVIKQNNSCEILKYGQSKEDDELLIGYELRFLYLLSLNDEMHSSFQKGYNISLGISILRGNNEFLPKKVSLLDNQLVTYNPEFMTNFYANSPSKLLPLLKSSDSWKGTVLLENQTVSIVFDSKGAKKLFSNLDRCVQQLRTESEDPTEQLNLFHYL